MSSSPGSSRQKVVDVLYGQLLKTIVDGEFKAGERFATEEALCQRFGTSRPTVREALARLRADGLIMSRQGSGTYVTHTPSKSVLRFARVESIADIRRCYEFRLSVEAGAARFAAKMHDSADTVAIETAYEVLNQVIASNKVGSQEDFLFHRAIALASKNNFFVSTLDSIQEQTAFSMQLSRSLSQEKSEQRLHDVQAEHARIVLAIKRRDEAQAEAAMREHIWNAQQRMFLGDS
jgi:GntR family transcriptional repressor for pyruvate dehydrogenase complex